MPALEATLSALFVPPDREHQLVQAAFTLYPKGRPSITSRVTSGTTWVEASSPPLIARHISGS